MTDTLQRLADRADVIDAITTLFVATDRRDWDTVLKCFADPVEFDMSSLTGNAPARLPPSRIVEGWSEGLAPIESVHHQAGNFLVEVDGDVATAHCYATATHFRRVEGGRNTRTFVGSYDVGLVRSPGGPWLIDLFRFNLKYIDGNLDLHTDPSAT